MWDSKVTVCSSVLAAGMHELAISLCACVNCTISGVLTSKLSSCKVFFFLGAMSSSFGRGGWEVGGRLDKQSEQKKGKDNYMYIKKKKCVGSKSLVWVASPVMAHSMTNATCSLPLRWRR